MFASSTISRLFRSLSNRRATRLLAELDDHLLADLGLRRGDVRRSLAQSIFTDPSRVLKQACCRWMEERAAAGLARAVCR